MKRLVDGEEGHLECGWIAEGLCPFLYTFDFPERKDTHLLARAPMIQFLQFCFGLLA